MKRDRNRKSAGFTMLEMMIIVVIIGIMASLAAPSFFSWIPRMKLKSDAKQNLEYLRQARSRAVAENTQYGVYFDVGNNQYYFFKDISSPQTATYEAGADSLISGPLSMESNIGYADCTFTNDTVVFLPNGSASTSGTIKIFDTGSTETYLVNVLAATGRVKLQHTP
jgi:type II secretion system protein H